MMWAQLLNTKHSYLKHSHERGGSKDMEKMDEEFTRREMEREYRSILDGGYVSKYTIYKRFR